MPAPTPAAREQERVPGAADSRAAGPTPIRARRRPWVIGLGALLSAIGALTVVWLVGAAGQRQDVLVVRSEVPYGQVLTTGDLAVVRVSVDPGVAVLPAARRDQVVGQVTTTHLGPGMLLTEGMVDVGSEPGPGRVLVPIAVPSERMPAGGLRAGDRLLLVDTEVVGQMPATSGEVVRVGPVDLNGVSVVDVTTSARSGPALAVAGANGNVALLVEPSGD